MKSTKPKCNITIGIPSNGNIHMETMVSLFGMINYDPDITVSMACPISCYIHMNREAIIDAARERGADYVLFVDTDMVFPDNALKILLDRKKDIIGVNYNFRGTPKRSVVQVIPGVADSLTEPFQCKGLGTGFMLIKMSVFEKLPRPWFFYQPPTGTADWLGDDYWFCNIAIKNGFKLWCDPSIKVGHIGTTVY